jgi:hypothetical protein
MNYIFILLGAVYVVAILAQMQAYVASTKKTRIDMTKDEHEQGLMAPQKG